MSEKGDFSAGCAFVNGTFVPIDEAAVPIRDYGFLRSDATYDVAHVWDGAFFRLHDHIERFLRNVERLRMACPLARTDLETTLFECVRRSGLRDAYVEMICTRGLPPVMARDPRLCENRFYAFAAPFVSYVSERQMREGIALVIGSRKRIPPTSVDPTVKNYHWQDLTTGLLEAYDRGADNVVLPDHDGNITEGPGFNVFCVVNGRVLTPASGVLDGITRRTVLEICAHEGIPHAEAAVAVEQFMDADEAFIASTAGGVMPVTRIESRILGNGAPGPVTNRLIAAYRACHADERYAMRVDYD